MGIRNNKNDIQKFSWLVMANNYVEELASIAEEYGVPNSTYTPMRMGSIEWKTDNTLEMLCFDAVRLSATRREFMDIIRDFKGMYPDAKICVMRS